MSGFSKAITFTIEFEGDHVKFVAQKLKRKHSQALLPFFANFGEGQENTLSPENASKMADAGIPILVELTESMTGLKDENGNALTIEEIAEETYFSELLMDALSKVMDASYPNKVEEGNSEERQDDISTRS